MISQRQFGAGGGIVLVIIAMAWLIWPSRYDVTNLESDGSAVIAFGDSLTAGYGAPDGEDYPARVSARIRVPIVNAGVSGDTTDMALDRLDDVLSSDPRIVIVGLGGNDFLRGLPIGSTESNLRTIVRRTQAAGAMVVLLGFRFPSLRANYESMYERIADEEKCLLIPDILDGIMSDPALKSDEIHPNGPGYDVVAERVAGPVRTLIARANDARR